MLSKKFYIYQIPLWEDNYIYIFYDEIEKKTAVIDPGDFKPVDDFLTKKNLKLDLILNTHHHWDHTGGNLKLKEKWQCPVYGFSEDSSRIPGITHFLNEGDRVNVGASQFEVIHTPGHTLGHIVFWNKKDKILFCGDTLFAMGCGRLFEGSPQQMFESLAKIKKLPKDTLVYCAHEYSLKNANFSLSLYPKNPAMQARQKKFLKLRKTHQSTIPFLLEEDLLTNPFLLSQSTTAFKKIRTLKDQY